MTIHAPPPAVTADRSAATEVVHVVDDEPAVQALFVQLGRVHGFTVVAHGAATPFLDRFDDRTPGCVVLDFNLPDRSGLEVLRELAARHSEVPVVFMSGQARISEAVDALKLGSLDFVEKPFVVADMVSAIRRALLADRHRRQRTADQRRVRARFDPLTPREFEVMQLVVEGLPNKTIAGRLGVSPKTVEVHRAHVMHKTAAESLAELVKLAVAAGFSPPPLADLTPRD